jgi:hypothetical protein
VNSSAGFDDEDSLLFGFLQLDDVGLLVHVVDLIDAHTHQRLVTKDTDAFLNETSSKKKCHDNHPYDIQKNDAAIRKNKHFSERKDRISKTKTTI